MLENYVETLAWLEREIEWREIWLKETTLTKDDEKYRNIWDELQTLYQQKYELLEQMEHDEQITTEEPVTTERYENNSPFAEALESIIGTPPESKPELEYIFGGMLVIVILVCITRLIYGFFKK